MRTVLVVGGGVTGLVAAHRLRALLGPAARITVVEQTGRLGGKLRTVELGGVPTDVGAEAFVLRNPAAVDLIAELGLGDALIHPVRAAATVRAGGRTAALPKRTFLGVPADPELVRPVLSAAGASRAAAEPGLAPLELEPGEDVPVGRVLAERFGRELVDHLVEPLLGGVYAGWADRLGLRATMPALVEALGAAGGSLTRAAAVVLGGAAGRPEVGGSPAGGGSAGGEVGRPAVARLAAERPGMSVTARLAAGGPAAEAPSAPGGAAAGEWLAAERQAAGGPVGNRPVAEQPATERSVAEQSAIERLEMDSPVGDRSAGDRPVAERAAGGRPTGERVAGGEPEAEMSASDWVAGERAAELPASGGPAGERPIFGALLGGMAVLIDELAKAADVRLGQPVRELRRTTTGWRVEVGSPGRGEVLEADAVVLAVPPPAARRLLADVVPVAASAFAGIEVGSVAVLSMVLPDGTTLPDTSGVLLAIGERHADGTPFTAKAFTHTSVKWGGAPVRLRASVGRAGETELLRRDDGDLLAAVLADLREMTGVDAAPVDWTLTRWGGGLPQYGVGHTAAVAAIERAVADVPGLAVAGAAFRGVGIPACIDSATAAANRIAAHLKDNLMGT